MSLEGKTVVVTGAGRGIGREIALECGRAGADVVLAARSVDAMEDVAAEITALGRTALVVETDVSDPAAVDAMAAATLERFEHVDGLVNNSGIGGPSARVWEMDLDAWKETLDVNVTGVMLCSRALLPAMIRRRSGSIVTIGSMTGKRPLMARSAYATSKLALVGLTRTMAAEAGEHGIRVNLISPGAVEGPRIEWVFERQAEARGLTVDEVRSEFESESPLRRLVEASDIAKASVFLISDAASGITGADINVTTGQVMY